MDVLIFKTNISNRWHFPTAQKAFNNLKGILKWTVDVEDIDHVLRLEVNNIQPNQVETALAEAGYYCEEMKD